MKNKTNEMQEYIANAIVEYYDSIDEQEFENVSFVPMLGGTSK